MDEGKHIGESRLRGGGHRGEAMLKTQLLSLIVNRCGGVCRSNKDV